MAKQDDSLTPLLIGVGILYLLSRSRSVTATNLPGATASAQPPQTATIALEPGPDPRYLGPPIKVAPELPYPGKEPGPAQEAGNWN